MVLSMLPMNVFALPVPGAAQPFPGASIGGEFTERNQTVNFTVTLPLASFMTQMSNTSAAFHGENRMRTQINLYRAHLVGAGPLAVAFSNDAGFTHGAGAGTNVSVTEGITATLHALESNNRRATLELVWNPALLAGLNAQNTRGWSGNIQITLPMRSEDHATYWANATASIGGAQVTDGAGIIIDRWRLWGGVQPGNVSISLPDGARGFSSSLLLNPIRVREYRVGTIVPGADGLVWLQLQAPSFYTWSFGHDSNVTVTGNQIIPGRPGTTYPISVSRGGSINNATVSRVHSVRGDLTDNQHVIMIGVNVTRDAMSLSNGYFHINNLWLTPDYNAPMSGNVYVEARLRRDIFTPGGVGGGVATWQTGLFRLDDLVDLRTNGVTQWVLNSTGHILVQSGANWQHPLTGANVPTGDRTLVLDPRTPNTGEVVRNSAAPAADWVEYVAATQMFGSYYRFVDEVNFPEEFVNINWSDDELTLAFNARWGTTYADWATALVGTAEPFDPIQRMLPPPVRVNTSTVVQVAGNPGPPEIGTGTFLGFGQGVNIGNAGYNQRLHVGIRGDATLSASVYNMQNMRTGHLGSFRALNANNGARATIDGVTNVPWNRDNSGFAHFTGVATASLIIEEDVPGAFSVGFGTPIHFEFLDDNGNPHPGIRVLGVQARAGNNYIDRYRGDFRGFHVGTTGWSNDYERQNWMTFAGWMHALDNRLPVVPGVGRVSDTVATVYLPSQTITDVRGPGALEIRFFLSLEAGYEWKYGSDVNVTISGAGVANLPASARTQTIGRAVDPIQTNITNSAFPVVEVETGRLYNIIGRQAIDDVIVDVINPGAFQVGDELWIYVTSDVLARSFDLNLSGIPTLNVEGSALRFSPGHLVNPQVGLTGREAVGFTVTRAANANEEPLITLSNLSVEGQAFPGVEYQLVLSGPSIAMNDQEVFNAHHGNAQGTQLRHMNRGVFTSLPYNGTIVMTEQGESGPLPGPGPGPQETREFFLTEGVPFAGVEEPLYWHIVGRNRVGMVSLRAFAYLVGGEDADFDWDSATRVGSVSSLNRHGEPVAISVTEGNPRANIRTGAGDQSVDMADYVRGLSGPTGSVYPINRGGRLYLPLRFVAELFGYRVERTGNVVRIF